MTNWTTCRIGSCHRHEQCMYMPCRSQGDRSPKGQDGVVMCGVCLFKPASEREPKEPPK